MSGPTLAAAVSQTTPIQAGLARVSFLRQWLSVLSAVGVIVPN